MGKNIVELPEIESVINRAVAREIGNPSLPEQAVQKLLEKSKGRVAGFHVTDRKYRSQLIDEATATLKERWSKYESTAASMRRELERREVNPIAILPRRAWEKLYTSAGLYDMGIGTDGKVCITLKGLTDIVADRRNRIGNAIFNSNLVACAAVMIYTGISTYHLKMFLPSFSYAGPVFLGFVAGVVYFMASLFMLLNTDSGEIRGVGLIEKGITKRLLRKLSWNDALKLVMPEQKSLDGTAADFVSVILPDLSMLDNAEEIESILSKVKDIPLRTIVDPALFRFEGGLEGVLGKKLADIRAEERLRWTQRDPIIAWYKDDVVAVIAQWGDSPFERRVVDQVASQHDLM